MDFVLKYKKALTLYQGFFYFIKIIMKMVGSYFLIYCDTVNVANAAADTS